MYQDQHNPDTHDGTVLELTGLQDSPQNKSSLNVYIESYGCQMNFADTEVVASILQNTGYKLTHNPLDADLILLNTCSIRDKAEQTIRKRLYALRKVKEKKPSTLIGILGCMAERLKQQLLEEEKIVDIVAGPDAYRSLPNLVSQAEQGHRSLNVLLSREETYADIAPVRLDSNGISSFVSIMRGCNNMCSFCVVPFTRGRERSRSYQSIIDECKVLSKQGYREVTLLGQNVDSYSYINDQNQITTFSELLAGVASVNPLLRVRFSTSHPKDITDDVLWVMNKYDNICNYIHLPVQSGSSRILDLMNRNYTREWYLERVQRIRTIIPNCGLSTDIISGFCTETELDHKETLSLMEACRFDYAYMFMYSEREGTPASKKMNDDVPLAEKRRRLSEIVSLQRSHSLERMKEKIDTSFEVLIEGNSKRSNFQWMGRNDQNQVAVFDKQDQFKKGDYVRVLVRDCSSATFKTEIVC